MKHPISSVADFNIGSLDIRIDRDIVLSADLIELNQNSGLFQKELSSHLTEAIECSFKAGRNYEKNRIKNLLNK